MCNYLAHGRIAEDQEAEVGAVKARQKQLKKGWDYMWKEQMDSMEEFRIDVLSDDVKKRMPF